MIRDLIALFGAGVASFLAPCLVPLLPAYLGIISGEAAGSRDPGRAVPATAVFVLGFATVFAALGAGAGLIGSSLHGLQLVVQRVGGVVVAIMGLALLGVVRGPLMREVRLIRVVPKVSPGWAAPVRPYVIGLAFGAAWTPCVGPLLAAALAVAAQSGQAGRGALLLLAYAFGIGVPFLVASLGLASWPGLARGLRRIGPGLERAAGVLLVVLGVLLATGTYRHLTSYLARFTPAVHGL